MSRKSLILLEMQTVVPRNALGYVSDLGDASASRSVIEDRLKMLKRHCPELVKQFEEELAKELERINVFVPASYKQAIKENGLNLSDFVREAMRREFKRRGIKVEKPPEIKPGRPWPKTETEE